MDIFEKKLVYDRITSIICSHLGVCESLSHWLGRWSAPRVAEIRACWCVCGVCCIVRLLWLFSTYDTSTFPTGLVVLCFDGLDPCCPFFFDDVVWKVATGSLDGGRGFARNMASIVAEDGWKGLYGESNCWSAQDQLW